MTNAEDSFKYNAIQMTLVMTKVMIKAALIYFYFGHLGAAFQYKLKIAHI